MPPVNHCIPTSLDCGGLSRGKSPRSQAARHTTVRQALVLRPIAKAAGDYRDPCSGRCRWGLLPIKTPESSEAGCGSHKTESEVAEIGD